MVLWIIIPLVFIAQLRYAFILYRQIKDLGSSLPEETDLSFLKLYVSPADLNDDGALQNILKKPEVYTTPAEDAIIIRVLSVQKPTDSFQGILQKLNAYLARNYHVAIDFGIMKDIIERPIETWQKSIRQLVPVPILLGLLGTIISIIAGVWELSGSQSAADWDINAFLGNVAFAMIASAAGVFLTVVANLYYRAAAQKAEERKNALFAFIQVQVLPKVDSGLSRLIEQMHHHLMQFNEQFTENTRRLDHIFDRNEKLLKTVSEIFNKDNLQQMKYLAAETKEILARSRLLAENFESLGHFITSLDKMTQSNEKTTVALNAALHRIDNIDKIARNLDLRLTESQALLEFLGKHFKQMEQYAQAVEQANRQYVSDIKRVLQENQATQETFVSNLNASHKNHLETISKSYEQSMNALSQSYENLQEHISGLITSLVEHLHGQIPPVQDAVEQNRKNQEALKESIQQQHQAMLKDLQEAFEYFKREKNLFEEEIEKLNRLKEGVPQRIEQIEEQTGRISRQQEQFNEAIKQITDKLAQMKTLIEEGKLVVNNQAKTRENKQAQPSNTPQVNNGQTGQEHLPPSSQGEEEMAGAEEKGMSPAASWLQKVRNYFKGWFK
jgi:hypothetical protein